MYGSLWLKLVALFMDFAVIMKATYDMVNAFSTHKLIWYIVSVVICIVFMVADLKTIKTGFSEIGLRERINKRSNRKVIIADVTGYTKGKFEIDFEETTYYTVVKLWGFMYKYNYNRLKAEINIGGNDTEYYVDIKRKSNRELKEEGISTGLTIRDVISEGIVLVTLPIITRLIAKYLDIIDITAKEAIGNGVIFGVGLFVIVMIIQYLYRRGRSN